MALGNSTITVSSPIKGDYLGKSNKVQFAIDAASFKVHVKAVATYGNTSQKITVEDDFTPNSNHQINDSLSLNFGETAPQGSWTIVVTPTEFDNDGNPINFTPASVSIQVFVDVKAPAFYTINPLDGSYVKGQVDVNATLNELNVDKWKVQINGADIPNNQGSGKTVDAIWDTSTIAKDGQQSVSIKVDDKAKNSTTKTFNLTVDRISPSSKFLAPGTAPLPPHTDIVVQVNVTDQFPDSVDVTGIDVIAKTLDNKYITRVSRRALNNSGNTLNWAGRLRWTSKLPSQFKIVVTSIDKAGNVAKVQETKVKIGNR